MLTSIDYDTLLLIFKQCGPSELLKLRSCCKQFKKIVDSPFFLKNQFFNKEKQNYRHFRPNLYLDHKMTALISFTMTPIKTRIPIIVK